ncbi:hypothetical protein GDI3893 (plasmid) [Gluconacetobacter diazotrophicus PA1 5]|uniref:Uncharacterized protein n=1 Tax=Gluconacetobacter diazotrophicus (strain ATCC 49037 / DSM 5601 / CCUG 37298 / CIP 103539 / LMG 7603 / PAl5) TaxID=272568 RepID=A9HT39_GLUDA|nr:hypothetical protein GDI3893 [Gluconacetobacter diazotrophicus PA1 5]
MAGRSRLTVVTSASRWRSARFFSHDVQPLSRLNIGTSIYEVSKRLAVWIPLILYEIYKSPRDSDFRWPEVQFFCMKSSTKRIAGQNRTILNIYERN